MAGQYLLAGVRQELDDVRRLDKIIEKARDGRGKKSIWEMSDYGDPFLLGPSVTIRVGIARMLHRSNRVAGATREIRI